MAKIRINKALAQAGLASRRGAEELIRAGRVLLNGKVVTDLATQVDARRDKLEVDGRRLQLQQNVYYLYYKPRGLVTTMSDPEGRPCLGDVCKELYGTPRPVGRLDRASEGLLLLTNDGQVALRMTHPRYEVSKEYRVTVSPPLTDRDARTLTGGLTLSDGPGRFEQISLVSGTSDRSMLDITIREGRQHFIRRMFEALNYRVLRLKRQRMGVLRLGRLKPGEHRQLATAEVNSMREALGLGEAARQTKG